MKLYIILLTSKDVLNILMMQSNLQGSLFRHLASNNPSFTCLQMSQTVESTLNRIGAVVGCRQSFTCDCVTNVHCVTWVTHLIMSNFACKRHIFMQNPIFWLPGPPYSILFVTYIFPARSSSAPSTSSSRADSGMKKKWPACASLKSHLFLTTISHSTARLVVLISCRNSEATSTICPASSSLVRIVFYARLYCCVIDINLYRLEQCYYVLELSI